jgi:uncharacterized membrane protein YgaE (UPF0421/DUF939 family)
MIEFLANSTFILWFSIIAAVVIMFSLELNSEGTATTAFSLAVALVLWNYGPNIWNFISSDILTTSLFIVGYLVCGVVWSFIKWNEFVKSIYREFKKIKNNETFETHQELKTLCDQLRSNGLSLGYKEVNSLEDVIEYITPKGIDNKSRIVAWISYWPLSLIATLLNNPFRRLFERTYNLVSGLYDKISSTQKAKALKNLK